MSFTNYMIDNLNIDDLDIDNELIKYKDKNKYIYGEICYDINGNMKVGIWKKGKRIQWITE